MKQILIASLLIIMAGCRKEPNGGLSNPLIGKWLFTVQTYSIGGPQISSPIVPGGQTVEFLSNGHFISTASFSTSFKQYAMVDTDRIRFTPAPNSTGNVLMEYRIDSGGQRLTLYPVVPVCIEGCSSIFQKVK